MPISYHNDWSGLPSNVFKKLYDESVKKNAMLVWFACLCRLAVWESRIINFPVPPPCIKNIYCNATGLSTYIYFSSTHKTE